ncbi:MAG: hypothetical protein DRP06_02810 [Candidatus Aenigmatarchaeota archaeon]|nr:MAG: hypothetical protein DRP06_02810 [Candidatus Aenigmarchaeota archaeon]
MEKLNLKLLEKLGRYTHRIRKGVACKLQFGTKISEITNFVKKKIFEKGYLPAFPCSVCVNNFAAHYTPFDKEYEFKKGEVVKIDFGISHKGFITDNVFTVEIGSDKYDKLLKANLEALNLQIEKIDCGVEMWELGK